MAIDVRIKDGQGRNGSAVVLERNGLPPGFVAYTEPFRSGSGATVRAYTNDTYGVDMNQNGVFSGTPDGIHNGTDSSLWTGSALSGNWTFDSTDQAQAGTKSVDATSSADNREAQFERSSAISTGDYVGLSGWIYLENWSEGNDVELRFRLSGSDQSIIVSLNQYIDINLIATWQKFSISLEDFEMGTVNIDQLIVKTIKGTGGSVPDYFLDNLQMEESGAPITFRLEPPKGHIYTYTSVSIGIVTTSNSTLADASHPNFTWNEFFGISELTTGITNAVIRDGVRTLVGTTRNFMDATNQPGARHINTGGDGTTTWWISNITLPHPVSLNADNKDAEEFIINDDLSSLPYFRVFAQGFLEPIVKDENA